MNVSRVTITRDHLKKINKVHKYDGVRKYKQAKSRRHRRKRHRRKTSQKKKKP